MNASYPVCPDCRVEMEGGFPLDHNSGEHRQATWVEGPAERGLFGVRLRGRRKLPMYAWRCPSCALVRFYAPEDPH